VIKKLADRAKMRRRIATKDVKRMTAISKSTDFY
jgi:hypothetical protein